MDPVVARDSVLVTDSRPSYATFAKDRGKLHIAVVASHGEPVYEGFRIQNLNACTSRLKSWMAPFKGFASLYLGSYLGWRRMIERDGGRLSPRHAIAQGLGRHPWPTRWRAAGHGPADDFGALGGLAPCTRFIVLTAFGLSLVTLVA